MGVLIVPWAGPEQAAGLEWAAVASMPAAVEVEARQLLPRGRAAPSTAAAELRSELGTRPRGAAPNGIAVSPVEKESLDYSSFLDCSSYHLTISSS